MIRALFEPRDRGTQLDLVHGRHDPGLGREFLEVRDLEVRDADRAGEAVVVQLFEGAPGRHVIVALRQRPVDEQQVHIVERHPLERFPQPADRAVTTLKSPVEFRRDEEVFTRDPRAADAFGHPRLVAVLGRGVDVPVSGLGRENDGRRS